MKEKEDSAVNGADVIDAGELQVIWVGSQVQVW